VAPAKDQRSVLMKGVDRQLHPRILRFGSRLSPASTPIATTAGADSVTGPDPQRADKPQRHLVTMFGAYSSAKLQDSRSARHSKSG
jgi:hypothetical protein